MRCSSFAMVTVESIAAELLATQQRLTLSESHAMKMAESLDKLRGDTDRVLTEANTKIAELQAQGSQGGRDGGGWNKEDRIDLVDIRAMDPGQFGGSEKESWRIWSKRVKAYCNARTPGFRKALEWAEAETVPIDTASLAVLSWKHADLASSKLFDMLILKLTDDPLIQAENHTGNGFEAWRSLSRRYDPIGEQFIFDRMTSLMRRERCKDIAELPAALERWTRDMQQYERKTGKTLPMDWRAPIIFQMVPAKNYTEIKSRWQLNSEKDVMKFTQELIVFANELKHEQAVQGKARGPAPMDLDNVDKEERYTAEEWDKYWWEQEASVDWMGKGYGPTGKGHGTKGGKKGGKGGKKGDYKGWRGGKAANEGCHWCGKEGHKKAECKEFDKWKKDKDEERKKKGLPPYVPKPLASMEPGGSTEEAAKGDYVGFDYDAGSLEFGADSLEPEINMMDEDMCFPTGDDEDEGDWLRVPRKANCECTNGACMTSGNHMVVDVKNMWQELEEEDYDEHEDGDFEINVVEKADISDKLTGAADPWKKWQDTKVESMAEMMHRERQELANKDKVANATAAKSQKPPGLPGSTSDDDKRSTGPWESVLMRRQSKPQEDRGVSTGTQTEVHLEHQIKSITWIPVVDTVEPVHDIDDDFYDEVGNDVKEITNEAKEQREGKMAEIQDGDVNDVDNLEIAEMESDNGKNQDMQHNVGIIMITMVMIFMMACAKMTTEKVRMQRAMSELEQKAEIGIYAVGASNTEIGNEPNTNRRALKPSGVRAKLKLRRGITLDSGAHHNVMPRRLVNQKKIRPSAGSKSGMHYIAANKGRIPNEGEVNFEFETMEGEYENWLFQIAEVNKALGAIADRVDNNYRVVFDKDMKSGHDSSYILNKGTNKIMKSSRIGNVWVIEAIVDAENVGHESFARLG